MEMTIDFVTGILLIVLGIWLINFYYHLVKQKKTSALSFKLRTAGIGLIMIGIALIFRKLI